MIRDDDGCWWMLVDADGCWWMDVNGCWWCCARDVKCCARGMVHQKCRLWYRLPAGACVDSSQVWPRGRWKKWWSLTVDCWLLWVGLEWFTRNRFYKPSKMGWLIFVLTTLHFSQIIPCQLYIIYEWFHSKAPAWWLPAFLLLHKGSVGGYSEISTSYTSYLMLVGIQFDQLTHELWPIWPIWIHMAHKLSQWYTYWIIGSMMKYTFFTSPPHKRLCGGSLLPGTKNCSTPSTNPVNIFEKSVDNSTINSHHSNDDCSWILHTHVLYIIHTYEGLLNWGYPQIIHENGIFHHTPMCGTPHMCHGQVTWFGFPSKGMVIQPLRIPIAGRP